MSGIQVGDRVRIHPTHKPYWLKHEWHEVVGWYGVGADTPELVIRDDDGAEMYCKLSAIAEVKRES